MQMREIACVELASCALGRHANQGIFMPLLSGKEALVSPILESKAPFEKPQKGPYHIAWGSN